MQIKKEEMRASICEAALKKFAEKGFLNTKMSDIAKEAGISVGNIYRYFMNKEDLFYSVLTPALVKRFKILIEKQYKMAKGVSLKDAAAFSQISEEVIQMFVKYRWQTMICIGGAQGTLYENMPEETIQMREQTLLEYVRSLPGHENASFSEYQRVSIRIIYQNLFQGLLEILKQYEDEERITAALKTFYTYHFFGLETFLSQNALSKHTIEHSGEKL